MGRPVTVSPRQIRASRDEANDTRPVWAALASIGWEPPEGLDLLAIERNAEHEIESRNMPGDFCLHADGTVLLRFGLDAGVVLFTPLAALPLSEAVASLTTLGHTTLGATWDVLAESIPASDRKVEAARRIGTLDTAADRKLANEAIHHLSVWLEGYESAAARFAPAVNGCKLALALHDHPDAQATEHGWKVALDPMAEKQIRAAVAAAEGV